MTTPSHPTKKEEHVPLYRVQDSRRLVIAVRLVNFAPRVATPNAFKDCSFLGPTTHTSSTNFLPVGNVSGDLEVETGRRRKFGLHEIRKLLTSIVNCPVAAFQRRAPSDH